MQKGKLRQEDNSPKPILQDRLCTNATAPKAPAVWAHKERIFIVSYLGHWLPCKEASTLGALTSYFAKFTERKDGLLSSVCTFFCPRSPQVSLDTLRGVDILSQSIFHHLHCSTAWVLLPQGARSKVQDSLSSFRSESSLLYNTV